MQTHQPHSSTSIPELNQQKETLERERTGLETLISEIEMSLSEGEAKFDKTQEIAKISDYFKTKMNDLVQTKINLKSQLREGLQKIESKPASELEDSLIDEQTSKLEQLEKTRKELELIKRKRTDLEKLAELRSKLKINRTAFTICSDNLRKIKATEITQKIYLAIEDSDDELVDSHHRVSLPDPSPSNESSSPRVSIRISKRTHEVIQDPKVKKNKRTKKLHGKDPMAALKANSGFIKRAIRGNSTSSLEKSISSFASNLADIHDVYLSKHQVNVVNGFFETILDDLNDLDNAENFITKINELKNQFSTYVCGSEPESESESENSDMEDERPSDHELDHESDHEEKHAPTLSSSQKKYPKWEVDPLTSANARVAYLKRLSKLNNYDALKRSINNFCDLMQNADVTKLPQHEADRFRELFSEVLDHLNTFKDNHQQCNLDTQFRDIEKIRSDFNTARKNLDSSVKANDRAATSTKIESNDTEMQINTRPLGGRANSLSNQITCCYPGERQDFDERYSILEDAVDLYIDGFSILRDQGQFHRFEKPVQIIYSRCLELNLCSKAWTNNTGKANLLKTLALKLTEALVSLLKSILLKDTSNLVKIRLVNASLLQLKLSFDNTNYPSLCSNLLELQTTLDNLSNQNDSSSNHHRILVANAQCEYANEITIHRSLHTQTILSFGKQLLNQALSVYKKIDSLENLAQLESNVHSMLLKINHLLQNLNTSPSSSSSPTTLLTIPVGHGTNRHILLPQRSASALTIAPLNAASTNKESPSNN